MLSIHRIARLTSKISRTPDSHWIELTMTEPDGETSTSITLYFQTRNTGFAEERRFVVALDAAINSIPPMEIGDWSSGSEADPELRPPADHPVEGDLGTVPL